MSDIPSFPYVELWGERSIMSVANLTRSDGVEFLEAADKAGIRPVVETFPLTQANDAIDRLRAGTLIGAAVLIPAQGSVRRITYRDGTPLRPISLAGA